MNKLGCLALSVCVLVGCGGHDDIDSDTLPSDIRASGTYAMTTTIDLTVAAVLPGTIYEYLDMLRRLREDPGGTFFEVLGEAGVPLVDELMSVLPDVVEDKVGDWIGEAIDASFGEEIDLVLDAAGTALTRFDLVSELSLPDLDASGNATATHGARSLRFNMFGSSKVFVLPASDAPPFITVANIGARVTRGRNGADGYLTLADHYYGVDYGAVAWQLIEQAAQERYGVGLREALGELVNCPAVAAAVASKCVLGVCVGHADKLEELCEKGLDKAIEKLQEKLFSLRFEAIRLNAGVADMWDAATVDGAKDGVLDRLTGGVWQCSINIGMGPRVVPAVFTAQRQ